MQSKYSLDLIPHRWLEYEPPSLCHEPITATLAALGIGEAAAAGTAAAATAAEVGTAAAGTAAAAEAAAAASAVGSTAAIGGTGLYGTAAATGFTLPSLGTVAAYGGPVLSAGGTLLQAQAQGRQGEYAAAVARAQAADQEAKANQEAAAGEQKAQQQDRLSRLVQSKYQATLADSGTTTEGADPVLADIAGQGQYNTLASLYAGLSGAQASQRQAAIDLFGARNTESGILPAQAGTVLAGLSSFLDKRARLKLYSTTGDTPSLTA